MQTRAKLRAMLSPFLRRFALICLFWTAGCLASLAAEPEWPAWRAELFQKLTGQLKEMNEKVEKMPTDVGALSRRGDLYLFLGAFPESVADFEKMIEIDPAQDAPHWRLGIAYYFNGEFAKSAKQFEKYHAYDGHDRENGIWKFLAQEKVDGMAKARAEMLSYTEFDREPFPALYEMYAGKRTPEDVFAEIEKKGLTKEKQVMFFASYYVGLYQLMLGQRQRALDLLRKAVDLMPEADTVYMWNVARLHWERLAKEIAKEK
jgi:lipoprotein NlpI